ncbi:putative NRPS-like protein biosynthetic cluster [Dispira simplex]|nr:putative NRPS-like protein biosynthetic cluster [Dispira simplex]
MRARFDQVEGEWRGQVLPIDDDPVQVNQVTLANGTDYWRVMAEANRTMNFTTGPIYLAYVMNYRDMQYFYFSLHHLIADNMSMNLLAEDICTLLNALSSQLDTSTTLALDEFGHLDTTTEDIILTGLVLAYTNVFDCSSIPLQYTSHGRNALGNLWDVSRTPVAR